MEIYEELDDLIKNIKEHNPVKAFNWGNLINIWKQKNVSQTELLDEVFQLIKSSSEEDNSVFIRFAMSIWQKDKIFSQLDIYEKIKFAEMFLFKVSNFDFYKSLSGHKDFYIDFFTTIVSVKGFIEENYNNEKNMIDFFVLKEAKEEIIPNLLLMEAFKVSVNINNKNNKDEEFEVFKIILKKMIDVAFSYDMKKFSENIQHQQAVAYELDLRYDMYRLQNLNNEDILDVIEEYLLDINSAYNQYKIKNRIVNKKDWKNFYVDVSEITGIKNTYSYSSNAYALMSGQGLHKFKSFQEQLKSIIYFSDPKVDGYTNTGMEGIEIVKFEFNSDTKNILLENDFENILLIDTGNKSKDEKIKKVLERTVGLSISKEKNIMNILALEERESALKEELAKIKKDDTNKIKKKI